MYDVDNWISLGTNSVNWDHNTIYELEINKNYPNKSKNYFFCDVISNIHRWDLTARFVAFHPINENFFDDEIKRNNIDYINHIYHNRIPANMVILLSRLDPFQSREVSIGKFDANLIKRINNLKVFW